METYPNMIVELFDAIHETYVDYPEVEADTYLYLIGLKGMGHPVGQKAMEVLNEMGRCYYCGNLLEERTIATECDYDYPTEVEVIQYCPTCDVTFE